MPDFNFPFDENTDISLPFCSANVNPELWRLKIMVKFLILKEQNEMKKVYDLKDKFLSNNNFRSKFSEEKSRILEEKYLSLHENYKKFIEITKFIQERDSYFDYKNDVLNVFDDKVKSEK